MILFHIYIALNIILLPFEESWNATHPNPFPTKQYIFINWNKDDFHYYQLSKTYFVLFEKEDDGKYKAIARKYWHDNKTKRKKGDK